MTTMNSDLVSWEHKPQCSVHWVHCSPSSLQHSKVLLQAWKDERINNCDRHQHKPSHTEEVKQARNTTRREVQHHWKDFVRPMELINYEITLDFQDLHKTS